MKISTIKAVNAYKTLKDIKVSSMSDDAMLSVWKDIKVLRPISDEYDKSVEETRTTLMDDDFKAMQARLQKAQEKEQRVKSEGYVMTDADRKEIMDINAWFSDWNKKGEKYLKDLADKEVEVKVEKVEAAELLKAFKKSDKTFEAMTELEWLIK
jgi:predicted transcriptional regulator